MNSYVVLVELFSESGNSSFDYKFYNALCMLDAYKMAIEYYADNYNELDLLVHEIRLCERR